MESPAATFLFKPDIVYGLFEENANRTSKNSMRHYNSTSIAQCQTAKSSVYSQNSRVRYHDHRHQ